MYIWTGIYADEQFEDIKALIRRTDEKLKIENSSLLLPLHIFLKISFEIDEKDFEKVTDALTSFYSTLRPFSLVVKKIENAGGIVWVRYEDDAYISYIKESLNAMLSEKFGVGMHEYDRDFIFHTTLFMDDCREKTDAAYKEVKDIRLPQNIDVSEFVIGKSDTGKAFTFSVYKTVKL